MPPKISPVLKVISFAGFWLLGESSLSAGTFHCSKDVMAYDPADPSKAIGTFQAGSDLELGESSDAKGMVPASFHMPDGTIIKALCRPEDVAPAKTSEDQKNTGIPAAKTEADTSRWVTDYAKALETAKSGKKLLLMDFTGSDWCGWCMKLDGEVFSKNAFKDYARKNLVLLKVDFPRSKPLPASLKKQNDELAQKYGINGYPTVIVLDSDGKEIGKLGYIEGGPTAFLAELKKLNR